MFRVPDLARDATVAAAALRIAAAPALFLDAAARTEIGHTRLGVGFAIVATYAVVTLVVALRHPDSRPAALLTPVADVAMGALVIDVIGEPGSGLITPYLFAPVVTAMSLRPAATVATSVLAVSTYTAINLGSTMPPEMLATRTLVFAWVAAGLVSMAFLLHHRERRIEDLLALRGRLIAETLAAEEGARARVALDLHDGPLQTILAATLELDGAVGPGAEEAVARAQDDLRAAARGLRGAVAELHPHVVEHAGLVPALAQLAAELGARNGATVDVAGDDALITPHDILLFRAGGELVRNALRHGQARTVHVAVRPETGGVLLAVRDDGSGFDPAVLAERIREGHIGLASLRERVGALGGSVLIDSAPGRGASVRVRVPLH